MRADLFLRQQLTLGEGMTWLADSQRIAWVDILDRRLFTANADGGDLREHDQPSEIGAVLPSADGALVLVRRKEVVTFDEATGKTRVVWNAEGQEPDSNRFNDAAIDPAGNLWIASMDFDAAAPTGNLWRVTPEGHATKEAAGFQCLNGPVFSNDGTVLYLGDTMNGQVLAFDLDLESGTLTGQRVFADLKPFGGLCDGMTVDADGNIWVCQITAGRIGCFAPDGSRLRAIAMPVPMVTSCCFGGPDLATLFSTTARIILDDADLAAFPESGSIFTATPGVKGAPPAKFCANREGPRA